MNKHIKHVIVTDVLPAGMGVPDAPKMGGTGWARSCEVGTN